MPILRIVVFVAVVSSFLCAAASAGGPFLDLTLDEALARAGAEKKIVFIDFFATWCGPCKQLDSTTFSDETVVEWLAKNSVPLKIDVDLDKEAAKRFSVRSMPTLVFLAPDGRELDRISGYRDSTAFLGTAADIVDHPEKDAVARAREELATGNWPEAMARQKLATALLVTGKQDEALGEYVRAMNSLGTDPMSRNFQMRLIREVCAMASDYAPAEEKLRMLRRQLVERLDAGEADGHDVDQITAIDQGLNQEEKTLELYNRLKEKGDLPSSVMSGFSRVCREALLEDRQYEALSAENPRGQMRTLSEINAMKLQRAAAAGDYSSYPEEYADRMKLQMESLSEAQRASILAGVEEHMVKRVCEQYQITLGVGKTTDAAVIAKNLLEAVPTAATYHALAANALRSGKPTAADLGYAGKAVELDRGEHPEYVETRYYLLEYFEGAAEEPSNTGGEDIPAAAEAAPPAEDSAGGV